MEYNQKLMDDLATNLENYLERIDSYMIIEGISEEDYKEAKETIEDLIKKLRKGKGDKVFNKERYAEFIRNGSNINNFSEDY